MHKVLLKTGASRGIGAAIARLTAQKYIVFLNYYRNEEQAKQVENEIVNQGGKAHACYGDVSKEEDVLRIFKTIDDGYGRLDALVNNAGTTGGFAKISNVNMTQINQAYMTNVLGTFLCTREAIRRMSIKKGGEGGTIVNISSTAARTGGSGEWIHYAATKGAINTFTYGAALEVASDGIRVNAVAPGLIHTDLHRDNGEPNRPQRLQEIVPLKRIGYPEEVAEAVFWLLSEASSYTTGAVLDVGGGR